MEPLTRRSFVKLAGAGSAAAATAAGVPFASRLMDRRGDTLRFRASGGLPSAPLPSYATHLVEGTVDLATQSGTVTSRVLAGHPGATSSIGLPGLARIIRITEAADEGGRVRLRGLIEDRSQLRRGESARVEIVVEKKHGVVHAPFLGRQVALTLAA
jgi:hypothetical protein